MRNASFQSAMARLALAAMLLLALLPTLGRLAPQAETAAGDGLAAMCTSAGLQLVALSMPRDALQLSGDTLQAPAHPHGDNDCAYCPLLVSLVVALCLAIALHCLPQRMPVCARYVPPRRPRPCPCGLGSRGPPLAL
jgi:hypothetical protein